MAHNGSPLHLFLVVLALVLFLFGAVPREPWPWRMNMVSAGLFTWLLSTFF
jgi:hypothetical protein